MKTFWRQGLLIGAVIVAVGCAGPQSNLSVEERLLTDGYPPTYVEGYMAGFQSSCFAVPMDKSNVLDIWDAEAKWKAANCSGQNVGAKGGQEPKSSKGYEQGREDGKIAGESSLRSYIRYMQQARTAQEMAIMYKPFTYPPYMQQIPGREEPSRIDKDFIYPDPTALNQPSEDFNK